MALPGETGSKESGGGDQNITNTANSTGTRTTGDTTNASTPKQPTNVDQDDRDFDPTAEALIDDIDDERTLEEEEALDGNNANAVQNELDDLKKESEMPIEELLAYYERMRQEAGGQDGDEDVDEEGEDEERDDDYDDDDDDDDNFNGKIENTDDIDKRSRAKVNEKSTTDTSDCTNISSSNHPANRDDRQLQQHVHQPQTDLTGQSPSLQAISTTTNPHIVNNSTNLTHNEKDVHLHQRPAGLVHGTPVDSSCQANLSQEENQLSSTDATNAISSSGRHKHSMTEFLIDPNGSSSSMFKTLLDYDLDDSDDLDEDYSYTDDENGDDERDWRRSIQIGPDHQADVPEGLQEYEGDLLPYEPEDKLVWRCNVELTQEQLIDYLKRSSLLSKRSDHSISPASVPKISDDTLRLYRERILDLAVIPTNIGLNSIEHNHENIISELPPENLRDVYMSQSRKRARIDYELEQENAMDGINQSCGDIQSNYLSNSVREENSNSTSQDTRPELSTQDYFQDEEQLLYLLLQCNYNLEEAIRRRTLDPSKYYLHEPMSLWSQEECLGFEHGLRIYGKNFHSIRENKVPTRTHSEVVAFYYLWKKSERHDVYTNQYKLDRKRCLTHPGTTDYMDRFIEDNESMLNASSSTPTPTPTPMSTTTDTTTNEINQLVDMSNVNNNNQLLAMCMPAPCLNPHDSILTMPTINHVELNPTIGAGEVGQTESIHLNNHGHIQ